MIITVSVTRNKRSDRIEEIFTWNPHTRYSLESDRNLYMLLRFAAAQKSIHSFNNFLLNDIFYSEHYIIYTYKASTIDDNIQKAFSFTIRYNPVLGKKSCRNCAYLKKFKGNAICMLRGNKGAKAIKMKGCYDWSEPLCWRENLSTGGSSSVYQRNAAKRNDGLNK